MDEAQFRPLKKGDLCNPILQEAIMAKQTIAFPAVDFDYTVRWLTNDPIKFMNELHGRQKMRKKELQKFYDARRATLKELTDKVDGFRYTVIRLETENEALKADASAFEHDLCYSRSQVANLQQDNRHLQAVATEWFDRCEEWSKKYAKLANDTAVTYTQYLNREKEIKDSQKEGPTGPQGEDGLGVVEVVEQLRIAEDSKQYWMNVCKTRGAQIEQLEAENAELTLQWSASSTHWVDKVAELSDTIENYRIEIERVREGNVSLLKQIDAHQVVISNLKAEIIGLTQRNDNQYDLIQKLKENKLSVDKIQLVDSHKAALDLIQKSLGAVAVWVDKDYGEVFIAYSEAEDSYKIKFVK